MNAEEFFNQAVAKFRQGDIFGAFDRGAIYYNRGIIRSQIGDEQGSNEDLQIAKQICAENPNIAVFT